RALSTADLQHELNAVMTPAMDLDGNHSMEWFIEDWVRGTGVPHYRIEYSTKRTERGFAVKGKLFQARVPRGFVAPVPIYSAGGTYLGRIIAGGDETPFHFNVATDPGKLQIDPQMTLLCVVDRQKPAESFLALKSSVERLQFEEPPVWIEFRLPRLPNYIGKSIWI